MQALSASQAVDPTALITLHDQTRNALRGFAVMVEKAEPSFQGTARKFHALHQHQAEALLHMLQAQGLEVDRDGTLMGTVNEVVVSLRAIFDEIDADTLQQIRKGEDHILTAFDAAIAEQGGATADKLRAMRADLTQLLAAV
ncbi:MAG: DUF2383 domain-containing protein [Rhodobacterales bacterium]|nr:MAG: DUF2383 domain-containing protein [Rhodobacterales bacterium]